MIFCAVAELVRSSRPRRPEFVWVTSRGEDALHDLGDGFRVATAGGELWCWTRRAPRPASRRPESFMADATLPCAVAVSVRVTNINRVNLMMMQNGVPHLRMPELWRTARRTPAT